MIPHEVLLNAAERSGFGGINRVRYLSRLKMFAEAIALWERIECADLCNKQGARYSEFENDFMDGKMDGAFMCAELIMARPK